MDPIIYPRSPREVMSGWVYLPRFVDKIRLQAAGKLHPDYQENFTKGLDGIWLKAAGLSAERFLEVVRGSITDGEVADWVRREVNARVGEAERQAHREYVLNYGRDGEAWLRDRLVLRKQQAGLSHRDDIQTFVDFIDADEGRL